MISGWRQPLARLHPQAPTLARGGCSWLLEAKAPCGTASCYRVKRPKRPYPCLVGLSASQGGCSTQGRLPRPCRKEGASVSGYLTVMQPGVCEDGLPALGQPKQAPSRLQSVKSLVPIIGGRVGEGWTPIAESSLEGQPAGRSGPLLSQPGPAATPVPQGRQDVSSPSLLLFPLAREGHFTHKPCSWCGGGGDSDACCSLSLCKD